MGLWGELTGKDAMQKVESFHEEMERVYGAFATRMIEILDKQERIQRRHAWIKDVQKLTEERLGRAEDLCIRLERSELGGMVADQEALESSLFKTRIAVAVLGVVAVASLVLALF